MRPYKIFMPPGWTYDIFVNQHVARVAIYDKDGNPKHTREFRRKEPVMDIVYTAEVHIPAEILALILPTVDGPTGTAYLYELPAFS